MPVVSQNLVVKPMKELLLHTDLVLAFLPHQQSSIPCCFTQIILIRQEQIVARCTCEYYADLHIKNNNNFILLAVMIRHFFLACTASGQCIWDFILSNLTAGYKWDGSRILFVSPIQATPPYFRLQKTKVL